MNIALYTANDVIYKRKKGFNSLFRVNALSDVINDEPKQIFLSYEAIISIKLGNSIVWYW